MQLQIIGCWSSAIAINWKPIDAIKINSKTTAINYNGIACITGNRPMYHCVSVMRILLITPLNDWFYVTIFLATPLKA